MSRRLSNVLSTSLLYRPITRAQDVRLQLLHMRVKRAYFRHQSSLTNTAGVNEPRPHLPAGTQSSTFYEHQIRTSTEDEFSSNSCETVNDLSLEKVSNGSVFKPYSETRRRSLQEQNDAYKKRARWTYIWQELYGSLVEVTSDQPGQLEETFAQHIHIAKSFVKSQDKTGFLSEWNPITTPEQQEWLPALLIGSLIASPEQALFVLSNVSITHHPWRTRMQCLIYIHSRYAQDIKDDAELRRLFMEQVARLHAPSMWPRFWMSPNMLRRLLVWSDPEQRGAILAAVEEKYPHFSPEMNILFALCAADVADFGRAMMHLRRLPEHILRSCPHSLRVARDRLLKCDKIIRTEKGSNFTILPQLLHLGFEPDASMHGVIIENAISEGFSDVAWDLYRYLKAQDLDVTTRAYLVLLRDAFTRGQTEQVDEILTEIHRRSDLATDPYLIAYSMNIVRVVSYYDHKAPAERIFPHLLALYDRAWNRMPLFRLHIVRDVGGPSQDELPPPPAGSLAFTIWSYVLIQRDENKVNTLWTWITRLVSAGDTEVVSAAKNHALYNGFILFYSRRAESLSRTLKVLRYMLEHGPCLPSSRTWSILVAAFLKHNQLAQAQRLVEMMQAHGLELEDISEEHLPHGYGLDDLRPRVEATLDDMRLPENLEEVPGDGELQVPDDWDVSLGETPSNPGSGDRKDTFEPWGWKMEKMDNTSRI